MEKIELEYEYFRFGKWRQCNDAAITHLMNDPKTKNTAYRKNPNYKK